MRHSGRLFLEQLDSAALGFSEFEKKKDRKDEKQKIFDILYWQ